MANASRTMSLPFRVDPTGAISYTEAPGDSLTQRVYSVLATQPGERIMRPGYGCNLRKFDFASDSDPLLTSDLRDTMYAALARWEPDAQLHSLSVGQVGDDGILQVTVFYTPTSAELANPGYALSSLQLGIVAASGAVLEVPQ